MKNTILLLFCLATLLPLGQAQIAERAEDVCPLLISDKLPQLNLINADGKVEALPTIISKKPSILLFYRGGWCPYCNAHLAAIGQAEQQIIDMGYQVIGISPDSPEKLKTTVDKSALNYRLYSDANGALIKAMGLAFRAPERYGDRLSAYSGGKNSGMLPVPAIYIVDPLGTIKFAYVSPDYLHRISAELLLAVLKDLNMHAE